MVYPQAGDGGMASNMEGSRKYIESAVADSRQEVVLHLERGANNYSPQKLTLIRRKYTITI
jgi:hypothetical protein